MIITSFVAVHGLGGHRERSWTAPNGINWLQDLLPKDLPNIRVYTWGYDGSNTGPKHEQQSLQQISENMVTDICDMREPTDVRKIGK